MSLAGPSTFLSIRANATENTTTPHASSADVDKCTDVVPFYYIASIEEPGQKTLDSNDTTLPVAVPQRPVHPMNLCASTDPSAYASDLRAWLFNLFFESYNIEAVFNQVVFFANQANLEQASSMRYYRRTIVVDPGTQVQRLEARPASIAILSILIGLHLAGVIGVAYYASRTPMWTATLDTFVMLQLGLNQ